MNDLSRQAPSEPPSDPQRGGFQPRADHRGALYAEKALQLRALAEHVKQPEARQQLLVLSRGYESLAARLLNDVSP